MVKNIFSAGQKSDMVSRTFHLYQRQIGTLSGTAKKLRISQSEMVRRSIDLFIAEFEKHSKAKD